MHRPAVQAKLAEVAACAECVPGKDEGLPDVVVPLAHDPVLSAHTGNVLAPVAPDAQDQVVKVLQVDDRVGGHWLLRHSLCQDLLHS